MKIVPHEALGPIRLGMDRDAARAAAGCERAERAREDHFFALGLRVCYDDAGRCEAIDAAPPATPEFGGMPLLGRLYADVRPFLLAQDPDLLEENGHVTSGALGIALHVPALFEKDDAEIESVTVFREGYCTRELERAHTAEPLPEFHFLRDFLQMVGAATLGFTIVYVRGVVNRPDSANVATFVWPVLSLSFFLNAGFACIALPVFHFLYTFPAYFVHRWMGRILRALIKGILITFPLFLLDGKVAYLVNDGNGPRLVKNNGEEVMLGRPEVAVDGSGIKSYAFGPASRHLNSFAHLKSELPPIDPSLLKPPAEDAGQGE